MSVLASVRSRATAGSAGFLQALFGQLDETLQRRHVLEMCMDGVFPAKT
ncbi:MAG: hypothetical protein OXF98_08005 [Rhodospirillaceae bacterium]|nr:hypothetical protein [Rhodospirillaceae bacterium]